MSRRNQSHRRRAYGRRQHEVRERRPSDATGTTDWLGEVSDDDNDLAWQSAQSAQGVETLDERAAYGDGLRGLTR